ncbi:hypothetical protein F4803DRAFT_557917 [Xylaria telfairii]|nr:hypothetical protein F4803DRAFT_557917 [Xylaria telfairii]
MALRSLTSDGASLTVSSSTQAYTTDYQCVTAHGNAVVSDGVSQTTISHGSGKAILTPLKYDVNDAKSKKGMVHISVHNPPAMTNKAYLQNLLIRFDNESDATIESAAIYYDQKSKLDRGPTGTALTGTQHQKTPSTT